MYRLRPGLGDDTLKSACRGERCCDVHQRMVLVSSLLLGVFPFCVVMRPRGSAAASLTTMPTVAAPPAVPAVSVSIIPTPAPADQFQTADDSGASAPDDVSEHRRSLRTQAFNLAASQNQRRSCNSGQVLNDDGVASLQVLFVWSPLLGTRGYRGADFLCVCGDWRRFRSEVWAMTALVIVMGVIVAVLVVYSMCNPEEW